MNIELTTDEIAVLKKLIDHEIEDINPEIHHTGKAAMRDELKQYRETLRGILEKLGQQAQ